MKNQLHEKKAALEEARLFRNSDDPHDVEIIFKWDNKENAKKYMESKSVQKVLKNVGAKIERVNLP